MLRSIFIIILITVGVYYGLQAPFYALLFYLANAYFRPEQWLWINIIPSNFSLILGVYTVLATLLSRTRFFFNKRMALIGILLVHTLLSGLLSDVSSSHTIPTWIKFFQPIVIAYCIVVLATDFSKLRQIFLILTLFLGLEAAKQGWVHLVSSPGAVNANTIPFLGDNNCVAVGMLMLLPIVVLMAQTTSHKWLRIGFQFMVIGILFRALSTYSRGGFLTCLAVGGTYLLRSRHKFRVLLGMGVILALILPALSDRYWDRMETMTTTEEHEQDSSIKGRLHFWSVAIAMANAHPILGIGFNSYNAAYNHFDFSNGKYGLNRSVHSSFFGTLGETGYVGAAIYWLVIVSAFRSCHRVRKLVAQRPTLLALHQSATALETSLVAFLVGGSFVPFQYNEMLWHCIGFIVALEELATRYVARSANTSEALPDLSAQGALTSSATERV